MFVFLFKESFVKSRSLFFNHLLLFAKNDLFFQNNINTIRWYEYKTLGQQTYRGTQRSCAILSRDWRRKGAFGMAIVKRKPCLKDAFVCLYFVEVQPCFLIFFFYWIFFFDYIITVACGIKSVKTSS